MKARFTGKDYMSFVHGRIYDIRTECNTIKKRVGSTGFFGHNEVKECLCVYDNNSSSWCPYSRLETMLQNWDIIDR